MIFVSALPGWCEVENREHRAWAVERIVAGQSFDDSAAALLPALSFRSEALTGRREYHV